MSYETQGTGPDTGAAGYELQGREPVGTTVYIVVKNNWPDTAYWDRTQAMLYCKEKNERNRLDIEERKTDRRDFYMFVGMEVHGPQG